MPGNQHQHPSQHQPHQQITVAVRPAPVVHHHAAPVVHHHPAPAQVAVIVNQGPPPRHWSQSPFLGTLFSASAQYQQNPFVSGPGYHPGRSGPG